METLLNIFSTLFSILTDNKILGMPILVGLLISLLIGFLINYIKGRQ